MHQEDDACYKLLFAAPEVVRDLVLGFIPDPWSQGLEYGTLKKRPGATACSTPPPWQRSCVPDPQASLKPSSRSTFSGSASPSGDGRPGKMSHLVAK